MKNSYLGNEPSAATSVVQALYPKSANIKVINEGQDNLVIVVDDAYSVRFPRSEEVWRCGLAERNVLDVLSSLALPTPKLLFISEVPAYIQTTYLSGKHLDAGEIRAAPKVIQQQIGREVATFAFKLHSSLSVEAIKALLVPPTWSYDAYLKRVLFDRHDPNPKVDALAKKYYQAWLDKPVSTAKVIVHDDLHTGNLLFDDAYHLSGVLDFGAICVGSPEQELRQTYRLGDEVFDAAVVTYERLSGMSINRDVAKLWTITQELASYCRNDTEEVHQRAFNNLRFWFPEIAEQ
jgi:aminoglycoside phosphotransferase (APT) family kinase protein